MELPKSTSEILMYSTLRIIVGNACGTGFFFNYLINEKNIPVLVTNHHVVEKASKTTPAVGIFHTISNGILDDSSISLPIFGSWIPHNKADIAIIPIGPLINAYNTSNKEIFYKAFGDEYTRTKDELKKLSAIEDIITIGYPDLLWNKNYNLPVFRKGITACHPGYDYNEPNLGLIDASCYKGASGSPVLILNEGGYSDKTGTYLGESRLILLGVLSDAGIRKMIGEVTKTKDEVNIMIPIEVGYYQKSYLLNDFVPILESITAHT